MSGRTDVLVAKDLAVAYGSTSVLTGVDLTLRAGDPPVGLIGASGAGKSSVVHALLGEVPPSLGSVTFNGRTVARLSRRDKRTMAVAVRCVHQGHGVEADSRRTVGQNVDAALKQARRAGRETGQDAGTLVDLVGLDPATASRFPHQISGGQRQRLAIAIAMASGPSVLLLDEPATALDEASTTEVLGRVFALAAQRGIGVLLVSHDLAMVDRLCPSVHVLADGRIQATGPLRGLLTDPELPALRELAEAVPFTVQPIDRVVATADRVG